MVTGVRMATKIVKDEIAEVNPPTLQKLFEDSSIAKLLDFLTLYRNFDYPKTEISKNSGVSWKTLYRLWPLLERYNLVIKTRQIGRATLYKLNTENPIAQALNKLALETAAFDADKELARQTKKQKTQEKAEIINLNLQKTQNHSPSTSHDCHDKQIVRFTYNFSPYALSLNRGV
jgi:hypothetical protein